MSIAVIIIHHTTREDQLHVISSMKERERVPTKNMNSVELFPFNEKKMMTLPAAPSRHH